MFRRVFYFSASVSTSRLISAVNLTYILYPQFPLAVGHLTSGLEKKTKCESLQKKKKERNKEQGGLYFVTGPFHMKCWGCAEELWQTGFHSSTKAQRVLQSAKSCQQRWPFNSTQRPRHTGSAFHGQGKGKDRGREERERGRERKRTWPLLDSFNVPSTTQS